MQGKEVISAVEHARKIRAAVEARLKPAQRLQELGFRIVFWPVTALYGVVHALSKVFSALKEEGTTASVANNLLSFEAFNQFIGLPQFQALEQKYKDYLS